MACEADVLPLLRRVATVAAFAGILWARPTVARAWDHIDVSANPGTICEGGSSSVSGTVIDEHGSPVPGASVTFSSTTSGTVAGSIFTPFGPGPAVVVAVARDPDSGKVVNGTTTVSVLKLWNAATPIDAQANPPTGGYTLSPGQTLSLTLTTAKDADGQCQGTQYVLVPDNVSITWRVVDSQGNITSGTGPNFSWQAPENGVTSATITATIDDDGSNPDRDDPPVALTWSITVLPCDWSPSPGLTFGTIQGSTDVNAGDQVTFTLSPAPADLDTRTCPSKAPEQVPDDPAPIQWSSSAGTMQPNGTWTAPDVRCGKYPITIHAVVNDVPDPIPPGDTGLRDDPQISVPPLNVRVRSTQPPPPPTVSIFPQPTAVVHNQVIRYSAIAGQECLGDLSDRVFWHWRKTEQPLRGPQVRTDLGVGNPMDVKWVIPPSAQVVPRDRCGPAVTTEGVLHVESEPKPNEIFVKLVFRYRVMISKGNLLSSTPLAGRLIKNVYDSGFEETCRQ